MNHDLARKAFRSMILSLLIAAGLAGCQTVQGAGEDIENAGEAMEDAAD